MTVRYEGAAANKIDIQIVPPGEELGSETLEQPAIALCYDEVFFIEGGPSELRAFVERLHAAALANL